MKKLIAKKAAVVIAAALLMSYSGTAFAMGESSPGESMPPPGTEIGDASSQVVDNPFDDPSSSSESSSSDPFDDPFGTGSGGDTSSGGEGSSQPDPDGGESSGMESEPGGSSSEEESPPEESQPPEESEQPSVSKPSAPSIDTAPSMITSVPVDSQDPTEFAPGDLDDLLSSIPEDSSSSSGASSSEPAAGGIFSPSSSSSSGGDGGPSTMLFAGIAFILLALCGIGFSVYQQFFKDKLTQRKASAAQPHSRHPAQSRGAADILGVEDAYDDNVYQDGYDYYDDPNGDYDGWGYDAQEEEQYTDISTAATNQPAQLSGTDRAEYTDISSSGPEPPDSAPQEKDIYSKEPSAPPKKGEDFDWDHFFRNGGDGK